MSDSNFNPTMSTSVAVSSVTASVSIAVPQGGINDAIRLYNSTPVPVFVRWGVGSQTAVATDLALAPGTVESFWKKEADTLAAICPSGSGTLYITIGGGR